MKQLTAMILGTACLALLLASGCGGRVKCGAGTVEQDGQCVVVDDLVTECGPGTERDGATCRSTAQAAPNNDTCTPSCDGKECGDDGCGGICALCTDDTKPFCNLESNTCEAYECFPTCPEEWQCGDDGCGGSCGDCPSDTPFCAPDNTCQVECVPDCDGRTCGDDGCGGVCGDPCGDGETCNDGGQCVPSEWQCAPIAYGDGTVCDCACGAIDPDCATEPDRAANCGAYQTCNAQGQCEDIAPAGWTCDPERYQDTFYCDCSCGAPDPDCEDAQLPINGCEPNAVCDPDGTCGMCTPDCNGKECGADGCGGTCGTCDNPELPICSLQGACVGQCDPTPVLCTINTCGDDGCGGSCGTCGAGESCVAGNCEPDLDPNSCNGICGQIAQGGCSCEEGCEAAGNCCADFADFCVACTPDCTDRVCGDDGCGGDCGACTDPVLNTCDEMTGQCVDPQCTGFCDMRSCGDDGCGGSCGTCSGGLTCFEFAGNCAPPEWICDPITYNDGTCDCGCGALDPDCAGGAAMVNNCPMGVSCDMASGTCQTTTCQSDLECGVGELCVGAYWQSGRRFTGACVVKTPTMMGMAGSPCVSNLDCDSEVCDLGICRSHCSNEMDCLLTGEFCVGIEPSETFYLAADAFTAPGWVSVCANPAGDLSGCASDADCLEPGDICTALIDGLTLAPRYHCTQPDPALVNQICGISPQCSMDLQCAPTADPLAPICARACPGGQPDCPANETCTQIAINDQNTAATADDILMSVCVP